jgi:hypothetical protein
MKSSTFLLHLDVAPSEMLFPGLAFLPAVCHNGFVWRRKIGTFVSEVEVKFKFKIQNAVLLKILVLCYVVLCALDST